MGRSVGSQDWIGGVFVVQGLIDLKVRNNIGSFWNREMRTHN